MAEVLRQGRKNPLLIHEGPAPESSKDTTPIVGMASTSHIAEEIVRAVNGSPDPFVAGEFRVGRRYAETVYWRDYFQAWFPDPAWASRVVAALNGDTDA